MSTTRYKVRQPSPETRITPEVLRAFRRGDAVLLQSLLGRRPWQTNVLDVSVNGPVPRYMTGTVARDYLVAQAIRRRLLEVDRARPAPHAVT